MKLIINKKVVITLSIFLIFSILSMNVSLAIVDNDKNKIETKTEVKSETALTDVPVQTEEFSNDVHSVFTLEDCVNIAIKHNPAIQSAICNEAVYKSKIGQAWANYFPRISASAKGAYDKLNSKDISYINTSSNGFQTSVSGDMLLFDFGKTKAIADMAKRNYESKQETTKESINTIIYNIKSTYYNILFAQAQVHVYEDTVADYELQLKQAWGFYVIGKKAKIDVVTAEYNLGKAKLNLVKARNTLLVANAQLSKIMGIPEYSNFELSDQMSLKKYEVNVDEAINSAMDVRPELIAAKKTADAAKMNLRAKRRDYAPDLGLFAAYGYQTENKLSGGQVGVGLNYTALNILKIKKQIDEANANYKKSIADYDAIKDTVYFNVKKNHIDLETAENQIIIAKLALDQATEQYRQVTGRYKAGIGDAIELKDGENTYLNARLDFYNTVLNYNIAAAMLEKEIGLPLQPTDKYVIDIPKELKQHN